MNEIELKARIFNKDELIEKLNRLAKFENKILKDDVYYSNGEKNKNQIRFRKEIINNIEKNYITYKHKKITTINNVSIEVNQEDESEIENPEVLERFLNDAGFSISLKKRKEVLAWKYFLNQDEKKYGIEFITLELCNIHPLGDFLEMEILLENEEKEKTDYCYFLLEKMLLKLKIPLSNIEKKYYSELLREINLE